MNVFVFSVAAQKIFKNLEPGVQKRIREKLVFLKTHPNLSGILHPLLHVEPATHRLRIGDYRLILEQKSPGKFCSRYRPPP